MNVGSDNFVNDHTLTSEALDSQQIVSNSPNFAHMVEDNLRLSNFSIEDFNNNNTTDNPAMRFDLQHHLSFDSQQANNIHLMNQQMPLQYHNWTGSIDGTQEMSIHNHYQQQQMLHHQQDMYQYQHHNLQCFTSAPYEEPALDLLNLLHLPGCSVATTMLPVPSIDILGELPTTQSTSASTDTGLYNQLNFSSQPPVFRELFHPLPRHLRGGSCFDGMDVRDANEGVLQDEDGRHFENSVLDFRRGKGEMKETHHYATERQRRDQFNEKYNSLRSLLPNPTKMDRASTVFGAIEYINELLRTVDELKILVKNKKFQRERSKRLKMEDETALNMASSSLMKPLIDEDQSLNGSLRSSWLLRKSKETIVDVRIIDDEVNIKLTQRKKVNCLLLVARILDELQMNILQAAGGNIGDYNIFLFNTKISEGSSVYASAIAQKLIEALDG